jgi:hypothetical protein
MPDDVSQQHPTSLARFCGNVSSAALLKSFN